MKNAFETPNGFNSVSITALEKLTAMAMAYYGDVNGIGRAARVSDQPELTEMLDFLAGAAEHLFGDFLVAEHRLLGSEVLRP